MSTLTHPLRHISGRGHDRRRTITRLCLVENIDGLAGEEEEGTALFERINKDSTVYGIKISAEKVESNK